MILRTGALTAMIAFLFAAVPAHAGEIEPRSYVNTPVGVNFLLAGFARSDGDLSTPAASPIKDAQLTMDYDILAFARSLDVWGKSAKIDVFVPYVGLSGNAMVGGERKERHVTGFADPRFRFSVNLYGAPAMSLQDFASYQQDLIIGTSLQVSAPLGEYEEDKLVNLGSHRWFFKPDVGISKAWGPLVLELSGGVFIYTDNNDFFGGKTLEQHPLYTTQAHITYNIGRGIWIAWSNAYDYGGRTKTDGVLNDDFQKNARTGVTVALPVNRNNSIKLYANKSTHTTVGNDYNMWGILWQLRWGGGL